VYNIDKIYKERQDNYKKYKKGMLVQFIGYKWWPIDQMEHTYGIEKDAFYLIEDVISVPNKSRIILYIKNLNNKSIGGGWCASWFSLPTPYTKAAKILYKK